MVTARDGELGTWRQRTLERHLARCPDCRAERAETDRLLAALDRLPGEAPVSARIEHEVLRRVRALADHDEGGRVGRGVPLVRTVTPVLALAAVVALAVVGVRPGEEPTAGSGREPTRVAARPPTTPEPPRRAKAPVPHDPPAALASHPELFVDLPVLRNLDKLEHFEAIAGMGEDAPTPSSG
jgi:hypothetical protein